MQLLDHLRCHGIQFVRTIQGDTSDAIAHGVNVNFSHAPSCHDYIEEIDTARLTSLRLAAFLQAQQGRRDPTLIVDTSVLWRATLTPDGPGSVRIAFSDDGDIQADGFGPGGQWLVDRVPGALGDEDQIPTLIPAHASVRDAQKVHGQLRIPRTLTPYHELLPTILAQRVTAVEALSQWRTIVDAYGSPAPGPCDGLRLPPDPEDLARRSYVDFHHFGIERRRADTIRQAARLAHVLIRNWESDATPSQCTESLTKIPGVGQWSAAVVGGISFGDPDALQVGDFHVKNTVAHALEGRIRGSDEEMVSSLEPYRGQRHRVVRWLQADGWRAPARGPRRRNLSIARL